MTKVFVEQPLALPGSAKYAFIQALNIQTLSKATMEPPLSLNRASWPAPLLPPLKACPS